MQAIRSPENILVAIVRLQNELPELIGAEGWNAIAAPFFEHLQELRQSTSKEQRRREAIDLVTLLKSYPVVLKRLDEELKTIADLRDKLEADLAVFAAKFGLQANRVSSSVTIVLQTLPAETALDHTNRLITIRSGGVSGATSIKLQNIVPNIGDIAEFTAGTLMTGADIIGPPHPLIVTAGILITIRSFYNMMTKEISEREASVLWGFIKARHKDNMADEEKIIEHTNNERAKLKFSPLSEGEILAALSILEELRIVELVEGKWRLIENYRIKT